jgi:hypothetical protein
LFEELWGLGQGIEGPFVESAGDEEIPGALWGAFGQHRGFNLAEACLVEVVADDFGNAVSYGEAMLHNGASQVDVAISESQLLADVIGGVYFKRRSFGGVEDFKPVDDDLDFAGGYFGICKPFASPADGSGCCNNPLAANGSGESMCVGMNLRVEDQLSYSHSVPQVYEDEISMVAIRMDPTGEGSLPAGVFEAQLAAIVRSFEH